MINNTNYSDINNILIVINKNAFLGSVNLHEDWNYMCIQSHTFSFTSIQLGTFESSFTKNANENQFWL